MSFKIRQHFSCKFISCFDSLSYTRLIRFIDFDSASPFGEPLRLGGDRVVFFPLGGGVSAHFLLWPSDVAPIGITQCVKKLFVCSVHIIWNNSFGNLHAKCLWFVVGSLVPALWDAWTLWSCRGAGLQGGWSVVRSSWGWCGDCLIFSMCRAVFIVAKFVGVCVCLVVLSRRGRAVFWRWRQCFRGLVEFLR